MRTNSTLCVLMAVIMMTLAGGTARSAGSHSNTSGLFAVDTRDVLVVTPEAGHSKTYGAVDPVLTYTFAGAIEGETPAFTGVLARNAGEEVGTYAITRGTLALINNGTFLAANYTLAFTEGVVFTITAKDASTLTIANIAPVTYDGTPHKPEPTVKDGNKLLVKDVDYTLRYADNIHAGIATVIVTGKGNYTGMKNTTFTINKAALTVTPDADQSKVFGAADPVLTYTFTGAAADETPGFTGILGRIAGEGVGTYAITRGTLALINNGTFLAANYTLAFTEGVVFTITAKDASTLTIARIVDVVYNGTAHTPEPEVKDGDNILTKGVDYTLTYANNINASNGDDATVTVTGQGNYSGTKKEFFRIHRKFALATPDAGQNKVFGAPDPVLTYTFTGAVVGEVPDFTGALTRDGGEAVGTYAITLGTLALADNGAFLATNYSMAFLMNVHFTITAKDVSALTIADIAPVTYNGTAHTPEPTVKDGDKPLAKGVDYTLSYADNTNAGTATVTVTGQENYSGTQDKNFTITAKDASRLTIADIDPATYDGAAHTPEPTVKDGDKPLAKGVDYTLSYADNINAGTATVAVTGQGNYSGTQDKNFTINKVIATVTPDAGQSKAFGADDPALTYKVAGVLANETPFFTGALTRDTGESTGKYAITQGTLTMADNDAFRADNYTLAFTEDVTFTITAQDTLGLAIAAIVPVTYDGTAHTPEPEVRYSNTILVKDVDYTLTYADNTNAGTATVTVTCQGNYNGTQDKNFTINKATLTVTPDADQSKTYGAADLELTYTFAGTVANETPVFTGELTRTEGEAVGTYAITQGTLALADNGTFLAVNYTLAFTEGVTFAITAKDASNLTIADVAPVTYDGTAHTPEPEVRDGDKLLEKDGDYTLAYADNTNAGTATVTVTGQGNYSGTQDKNFTINKATANITWTQPAPIVTGMKLSGMQLNASANTPGTFIYDPPAGTTLPAGVHALTAAFTPDDTDNWTTPATTEVELRVAAGTTMWLTATVGNGENPITLVFGETETAALGEDAFDVAAAPGQSASLCSLPMSASDVRHLSHDFRPFPDESGITRWRLEIAETGRRGESVTLTWDISAAAPGRQLYLQQIIDEQPVGHPIDMYRPATVNSGTVYEIAYAPISEVPLTLKQGWNLIGYPVMSRQIKRGGGEGLVRSPGGWNIFWHWKNGAYEIWPLGEPLRPEAGYFYYHHDADKTITLEGIKPDGVMLLQPGWNLVSPPSDCLMPVGGDGVDSRAWYLRDSAYQFVDSGGVLKAGCSYWIFVQSNEPVLVNFGD